MTEKQAESMYDRTPQTGLALAASPFAAAEAMMKMSLAVASLNPFLRPWLPAR